MKHKTQKRISTNDTEEMQCHFETWTFISCRRASPSGYQCDKSSQTDRQTTV